MDYRSIAIIPLSVSGQGLAMAEVFSSEGCVGRMEFYISIGPANTFQLSIGAVNPGAANAGLPRKIYFAVLI